MKHEKFFNQFMENEVNLNKDRLNKLQGRTRTIREFLRGNLKGHQKMEHQGSYGTKTIIKPPKDKDFDADMMVYVKENEDFEPKDYIDEIYNLFKGNRNYKNIVGRKSRCVTLDYSGDFHLDIVPCVEQKKGKHICNKNTNKFEITDGTAYKEWLIEKNKNSGNYLKKVIKLLKYLRDIKTNFSCKSILLTTLLGNQISNNESFSDLPTALKEISNRLNDFLQQNEKMPIVKNPVLEDENFNRHWNEDKYSNFRKKFNLYVTKINDAFEEKDHNESVRKWREIFGDEFGELQENNKNASAAAFTTEANKPYCDKY